MKLGVLAIAIYGLLCYNVITVSGLKCYSCIWVNSNDPIIKKAVGHKDNCKDNPELEPETTPPSTIPPGSAICMNATGKATAAIITVQVIYRGVHRDRWAGARDGKCDMGEGIELPIKNSPVPITFSDKRVCYCKTDGCNFGRGDGSGTAGELTTAATTTKKDTPGSGSRSSIFVAPPLIMMVVFLSWPPLFLLFLQKMT